MTTTEVKRPITRAEVREACNIATGGSKTPEELDKLTDKVMLRYASYKAEDAEYAEYAEYAEEEKGE